MIRLTGLPSIERAPEVRLERTADAVVLWFLAAGDERPVRCVAIPRYTLDAGEDLETAELDLLSRLQRLGYDARRITPRV